MKHAIAALAATALLALAGCGDDEDADRTSAGDGARTGQRQESTAAERAAGGAAGPEAAFRRYQSALAGGDAGTLCALLTDDARGQVEEASIGGSCEDWVEELSGTFTDDIRAKVRDTEVLHVREDGDTATVGYRSPILDIPLELEFERSGGGWLVSRISEGV